MTGFGENGQTPQCLILNPLNPQIKILFHFVCVTFLTLMTQTSCKISGKTNEQFLEIFTERPRIDHQLTDGQGRLPWTRSGKPGVQNVMR